MERVLIVDDDPDILRLVSYNIGQAGFEVLTAANGRNALEIVQKRPPDLIILDVMLPDIDGMEVCRTLQQQNPSRRIPIIMLTARGDEIDRVVGFELGADDYVSKPFSPRELVLRVKSILAEPTAAGTHHFNRRRSEAGGDFDCRFRGVVRDDDGIRTGFHSRVRSGIASRPDGGSSSRRLSRIVRRLDRGGEWCPAIRMGSFNSISSVFGRNSALGDSPINGI